MERKVYLVDLQIAKNNRNLHDDRLNQVMENLIQEAERWTHPSQSLEEDVPDLEDRKRRISTLIEMNDFEDKPAEECL